MSGWGLTEIIKWLTIFISYRNLFFLFLDMRISEQEIALIKKLARQIFGKNTKVFLFGSRVDDQKKGGDIDLFITGDQKSNFTVEHKIDFLVELKALIGDQKIDVILDTESTRQKKQFHRSITRQAVEL